MVTRSLVVLIAALLGGCAPTSTTCGRGRCPTGSCLNVISTYVAVQEYQFDWWCAVPCPATAACGADLCLQSPINWSDIVCAGNQLEVKYTHSKLNIEIVDAHVPEGTVRCAAGAVCSAGWYRAGELLPVITTTATDGSPVTLTRNGTPGETLPLSSTADPKDGKQAPLGPLLPTGLPVVVHIDGMVDAQ